MDSDRRIDALADRLSEELVRDDGTPLDATHVAQVVHAHADHLADAPVQDFVPLLVENESRDDLRREGVRRALPEDPPGPIGGGGAAQGGTDVPSAK